MDIDIDHHKIRVGYSQMQALVEAYRSKPGSDDFPDAVERVVSEAMEGDLAENLFHLLFGGTLFASMMLTAARDSRTAALSEVEILRRGGQAVNLQLELGDGPG